MAQGKSSESGGGEKAVTPIELREALEERYLPMRFPRSPAARCPTCATG